MPTGSWTVPDQPSDFSNTKAGNGGHTVFFGHTRIWSDSSGADNALWGALYRWVVSGANAPTRGATITSAVLKLWQTGSTSNDLRGNVHYLTSPPASFSATDNPWTTYARSSSSVVITGTDIASTGYTSFTITSLVQELVNLPSWDVGDTVGLAVLGDGTTTAKFDAESYSNPSQAPVLEITWSTPTNDPLTVTLDKSTVNVRVGEPVVVTGTVTDDDTVTSTQWRFTTYPSGATAAPTLSTVTVANDRATVVPDVEGTYVLRWTVSNDNGETSFAEVTINASAVTSVSGTWVTIPVSGTAPTGAVAARVRLVRTSSQSGERALVRRSAGTLADPGRYTRPLSTTIGVVQVQRSIGGGQWTDVATSPGDLNGITFITTDTPGGDEVEYRARIVDEDAAVASPWSTVAAVDLTP